MHTSSDRIVAVTALTRYLPEEVPEAGFGFRTTHDMVYETPAVVDEAPTVKIRLPEDCVQETEPRSVPVRLPVKLTGTDWLVCVPVNPPIVTRVPVGSEMFVANVTVNLLRSQGYAEL